jgi:hypothetical protein
MSPPAVPTAGAPSDLVADPPLRALGGDGESSAQPWHRYLAFVSGTLPPRPIGRGGTWRHSFGAAVMKQGPRFPLVVTDGDVTCLIIVREVVGLVLAGN